MPNRYPDAWPQTTRHERPSEVDRKREYDDEAILVPIPLSAEELAEREKPSDEDARRCRMTKLRAPLRPRGAVTLRWAPWRSQNYELLRRRCRGICEGCSKPVPLDVHHVIGRRDEPFSSHVALLAGLCRNCHRAVTGEVGGTDHELRRRLDVEASLRLIQALGSASVEGARELWEWDGRRLVSKEAHFGA